MGIAYDLNALSGINAASSALGVISNNLANSQSVGYKTSRAEFSDLFSGSQNSPGNGTSIATISQDFSQGTINGTGRELDMAISGEGFFIMEDQTGKYDNVYTRNGSFKLDKEGYLTAQEGNRVQGYLLNEALSTDALPVFDTTLSSIDLDALNKKPKATDAMTFDINLDGQESNNVSTTGVSVSDTTTSGTPARTNLARLVDFENATAGAKDPYSGFPDFSTNKIVHDSLGGEHRLTANYYKRDVVSSALSTTDANGATVAAGTGVKYSSWIVQYTMQDYDESTQKFSTSGHVGDAAGQLLNNAGGVLATPDLTGADKLEAQLFEVQFDTSGNLLTVKKPDVIHNPGATVSGTNAPLAGWTSTAGGAASSSLALNWVIDTPFAGANDPLGNVSNTPITIDVAVGEMTQFSGSYNLRGVSQNGFKIGDLVGLSTGLDGTIEARYSNGRSLPVAVLGVANFADKNSMEKLGGMTYAESFGSGDVQLGTPQNNGFGTIKAGSLEYSNVDVAGELVNMIQIQRTYQASAQVISTSQTLTQTILNL